MQKEKFLGGYMIEPAPPQAPGWYAVFCDDADYPGGKHYIAMFDTQIGAAAAIVGVNYVQAMMEGKPEKIRETHDAIDIFLAALR